MSSFLYVERSVLVNDTGIPLVGTPLVELGAEGLRSGSGAVCLPLEQPASAVKASAEPTTTRCLLDQGDMTGECARRSRQLWGEDLAGPMVGDGQQTT